MAPSHLCSGETDTFLSRVSLPTLSEAHMSLMDQDIQVSEVLQCIKDLKVGKQPGPEGFTVLYYRKLADVIAPHLTAMYNSVKNSQNFPSDLLTANIVMLPKPDRDHSSWANFRPVSLINIDMKILRKILANCLNAFLLRFSQEGIKLALFHKDKQGMLFGTYCS